MANFTTIQNSLGTNEFATNVERSIVKAATFNSGSPQATQGYVRYTIDATTLPAGSVVEIRRYLTAGPSGTQRQVDIATIRAAQVVEVEFGLLVEPWDVTIKLTAGASPQTLGYVVKQDTNDVNAASISNGAIAAATFAAGAITSAVLAAGAITSTIIASGAIGASQLASAAITAAKFATDAIDGNALAAAAVTKIQSGLALATTALSNVQWTNALAAALAAADFTRLDIAVSSRGTATIAAVAGVQSDTTAILGKLPTALVGGRMSADVGSWLGTAAATPSVAGIPKVEDATMQARIDATRAAKIDQLDAAMTSRAPQTDTGTIITLVTAIGSALTAVGAAVTDVQGRIPAVLDAGGNIKAGVQSLMSGALTSIVDAVNAFVEESGAPSGARTFLQRRRILWSVLGAGANGLAITIASLEHFLSADGSKSRLVVQTNTDGTRTVVSVDGD